MASLQENAQKVAAKSWFTTPCMQNLFNLHSIKINEPCLLQHKTKNCKNILLFYMSLGILCWTTDRLCFKSGVDGKKKKKSLQWTTSHSIEWYQSFLRVDQKRRKKCLAQDRFKICVVMNGMACGYLLFELSFWSLWIYAAGAGVIDWFGS